MRSRLLTTLLAAMIVVGGLNIAAYAATGGAFILGKSNSANKTTTLKSSANGAALKLAPKAGRPPLAVTSSQRVTRLNADQVDGQDAAALETRSVVYAVPAVSEVDRFAVGTPSTPGAYRVDYSISVATSEAGVTLSCYWNTTLDGSVSMTALDYGGSFGSFATSNGSATVVSSGTDDWLECFTDSGTATTSPEYSQVVVTPINAVDAGAGTLHPRVGAPGAGRAPGLG